MVKIAAALTLLLGSALAQDDHAHGEVEVCACAATEDIHLFSTDCADATAIAASATLLAACPATEAGCKDAVEADGTMPCQGAFFHLVYIHGWCADDTLSTAQETLIHTYEDHCAVCTVGAPYDPLINDCAQPTCTDPAPALAAFNALTTSPEECVLVAGTATEEATAATTCTLTAVRAEVSIRAESCTDTVDVADCVTGYTAGTEATPSTTCPTACTQVAATSSAAETCIATVPETVTDCVADGYTAGTATTPSANCPTGCTLITAVDAVSAVTGACAVATGSGTCTYAAANAGACVEDGGDGTCCRNAAEVDAWKTILAYHDLCDEDDVPAYVEIAKHEYAHACEDSMCNTSPEGYDATVCPPEPVVTPAPSPTSDAASVGASAAVLMAAYALA